jgi:aspartyl-tRNA(Asn)/glutamyl-tRNA(Gln) amidotransferase subunit A
MQRGAKPDLWRLGVRTLAERYEKGDCDPVAVTMSCLQRIRDLDPEIKAFRWVDEAGAMDSAQRLAREPGAGRRQRLLYGIPIAVKELFDVRGAPSDRGSLAGDGHPAARDASLVRALRRAGAIVLGTTRSHEFGWGITSQHGRLPSVRNPWNTNYIPGGSSGGSAAAVASGMAPAAIASDTGGSIRIPSSFCGVSGLKPGWGIVSADGLAPLAPSMDTPGVIAREVGDLWPVFSQIAAVPVGSAILTPLTRLDGLRVAQCAALVDWAPAGPQLAGYQDAIAVASQLGAKIIRVDLPAAREFQRVFRTVQMAEAYQTHARVLGTFPARADLYGEDVRGRIQQGATIGVAEYARAQQERRRLTRLFEDVLDGVDVLLTPICTVPTPGRGDPDHVVAGSSHLDLRDAVMGFTIPQNVVGLPCAAFRAGWSDDGLPYGAQLTSRRGSERSACAVAGLIERKLVGQNVRFPE